MQRAEAARRATTLALRALALQDKGAATPTTLRACRHRVVGPWL